MPISSLSILTSPSIHFQTSKISVLKLSTLSAAAEQLLSQLEKSHGNVEKTLASSSFKTKLDSNSINEVLHRCPPHQFHLGLRFFIWAGTQSSYRHSSFMYGRACEVFRIRKSPGIIRDVVEGYRNEGCFVSVKAMKVVLNLCRQARLADEALWVLRKMPEFNLRADTVAYNLVIRLFVEKGDMDKADKLMKEMGLIDLYPDMITYVSMIKGFSDAGKLEDACRLLKVMRSHGCAPNAIVYSTLLDGVCRFGSIERAMKLLGEMEEGGGDCSPNTVTYTLVIQALCDKQRVKEALGILDRMMARECIPNRVTIAALIKGLCEEGHVNDVYKLVDRVVLLGGVSHGDCYSSLVISLVRVKRCAEAEKLFGQMLTDGLRPDGLACSTILKAICREGRFLDAFGLYEEMEKMNVTSTIDSEIFSDLLVGLCEQGHTVEAAKFARLMVVKGIRLKASCFDKIVEELKKSGDEELMLHLTGTGR